MSFQCCFNVILEPPSCYGNLKINSNMSLEHYFIFVIDLVHADPIHLFCWCQHKIKMVPQKFLLGLEYDWLKLQRIAILRGHEIQFSTGFISHSSSNFASSLVTTIVWVYYSKKQQQQKVRSILFMAFDFLCFYYFLDLWFMVE